MDTTTKATFTTAPFVGVAGHLIYELVVKLSQQYTTTEEKNATLDNNY